jgi:hypothetical protein
LRRSICSSVKPRQLLVLAEEVVAVKAPVFGGEGLHLAVYRIGKGAQQRVGGVAGKQAIPIAAPDQLDHIPAGTDEQALEFVNDAAVAAHRSVQALQIAINHPDQVVELFPRGQGERTHAFRFVHLTIAENPPDFARAAVLQVSMREVAHETRVVNRADGANAHGAGRKLPEVGHQPGMRVAAQTPHAFRGGDLLPVMGQVGFVQAPFQKCTGIHARRAMRLEEHQVAAMRLVARMEKMVEAHLKQICCAGIAGNVAAQLAIGCIGTGHHRQGIPAHQRTESLLDREVSRESRLTLHADRVGIRRGQVRLPLHLDGIGQLHQVVQDEARALRAMGGHQRHKTLAPFGGLRRVNIALGGGQEKLGAVIGHRF